MAGSGLAKLEDGPWPLGSVQIGSLESIPAGGASGLYDGLWGEDGLPYRRGGSAYRSNAVFGSGGLRWLFAGNLAGGFRTVFQTSADTGMLGADDATPASIETSGVLESAVPAVPMTIDHSLQPVNLQGVLFFLASQATGAASDAGGAMVFAGSRKTAQYATGLYDATEGNRYITAHGGSGAAFTGNVDAGMMLYRGGGADAPPVPVVQVLSNTELLLASPWELASGTYAVDFRPADAVSQMPWLHGEATALGVVGTKILVGAGRNLWVSETGYGAFASGGTGGEAWSNGDVHLFDSVITGVADLRGNAVIFTQDGTYIITGIGRSLTDTFGNDQRSQARVNDLSLWGARGIAEWNGSVVVPALDGLWLMDSVNTPVKISRNFQSQYIFYVQAGYQPGQAVVFEGIYYLPILDASFNPADMLTCRLTPISSGQSFQWSQMRGHGGSGNVCCLDVREPEGANTTPRLLAGGDDGKVSTLYWSAPTALTAAKQDADGVAHSCLLETRAFSTGGDVANQVRFVKVHYTLTDAASDNPTISLSYALDGVTSFTTVSGSGAETSGAVGECVFRVEKQARLIQIRVFTANATSGFRLRGIELQISPSGRQ